MNDYWPKENISIESRLFCRVHYQKVNKVNGAPAPSAFYNTPKTGPDLSSDWDKYSNPQQSRALIGFEYKLGTTVFKNPEDFFITEFLVENIYKLELNQIVEHSPKQIIPDEIGNPNNRAHSSIIGDKNDEELRLKFVGISEWRIAPPNFAQ